MDPETDSQDGPRTATLRAVEGTSFSVLQIEGFAPEQVHGFVVRGTDRTPLFAGSPVPGPELARALGAPGGALHLPRQVHGASVLCVEDGEGGGQADGLVTDRPGMLVGVATADCLPILIAAPGGACAALHAGWRGLIAGVLEEGVRRLLDLPAPASAAGSPPTPGVLSAAMGPAIGACCFEVDEDVARVFRERFGPDSGIVSPSPRPGKSRVDLRAAAVQGLAELGLPRSGVTVVSACTRCGPPSLESFRRDGPRAGRMIAVIGPRP